MALTQDQRESILADLVIGRGRDSQPLHEGGFHTLEIPKGLQEDNDSILQQLALSSRDYKIQKRSLDEGFQSRAIKKSGRSPNRPSLKGENRFPALTIEEAEALLAAEQKKRLNSVEPTELMKQMIEGRQRSQDAIIDQRSPRERLDAHAQQTEADALARAKQRLERLKQLEAEKRRKGVR